MLVGPWADGGREGLTGSIDGIHDLVGTSIGPFLQSMGGLLGALAAIDQVEDAAVSVRPYVRRCATGGLAEGESDAIVVLAALCEAQSAIAHARRRTVLFDYIETF